MADRFVSEKQLEEERASGVPQRRVAPVPAKPLYEQLKENREKQEEEWKEKTKFRGPRVLDIDDVTYYEERNKKRMEAQLQTEQEIQDELKKFEVERAKLAVRGEDVFIAPVIIKKDAEDDEIKRHKKPAGLSKLLGVVVEKGGSSGVKRKHDEVSKDKGKEKEDDGGKKKVVVLTPFAVKPKKVEDKKTTTNGNKEKTDATKKTDSSKESKKEEEEEEEGGGGLLSLVDY